MARETPSDKPPSGDPFLDEKLKLIARVVGYLFPNGHFSNNALADALEVEPSTMSRKRSGAIATTDQEYSYLVAYCSLDRLTADDIKGSAETLDAALRRAGLGLYGARDGDAVRHRWLSDPQRKSTGVVIRPVSARRAGLGSPRRSDARTPRFHVDDKVVIDVETPDAGHLVVLSDDLTTREATCLAPSCYAPRTTVKKGLTRIPIVDPNVESTLTVLDRPSWRRDRPSWCRLYVFWTHDPLGASWAPADAAEQEPSELDAEALRGLEAALDRLRKGNAPYRIMTADFCVVA